MDPRALADGVVSFFRPDPLWRRQAVHAWLATCAGCAAFITALVFASGTATTALTTVDANLAYGFARVDPPVIYQLIRGRYAYCGYDWDRVCQLRDPAQSQPPAVDHWLDLYPPSLSLSIPPAQGDVAFMETQGATSLIDDPRFADTEYFLGLQDVTTHVLGKVTAGGLATLAALVISLSLGFATFGGARSRSVNPLWFWFALTAAAFYAWAALHVLAEPAGFAIVIAVEIAAVAAIPVIALVRLRSRIAKQELAYAYFHTMASRARAKDAATLLPGGRDLP